MVEAALRAYATSPHLRELEQPFSSAPGPHDSEQARHDMRLAIEAALATPSPTIAAPSPSQSNAIDLPPCPVCGETLVTRYSGPLPGCPQGISTAVCPTDPSHASQPPQASPSNADRCAAPNCGLTEQAHFVVNHIFVPPQQNNYETLEATLKARKPADEGAGQ